MMGSNEMLSFIVTAKCTGDYRALFFSLRGKTDISLINRVVFFSSYGYFYFFVHKSTKNTFITLIT